MTVDFEPAEPEEQQLEFPAALPVLPLKDTVVFPQSMSPLAIGQERSVRLIDDVVAGDRLLALITTRDGLVESPGWEDIYEVGTIALVHKMIKVPDGTLRILVQGIERVHLDHRLDTDPYLLGEFSALPDVLEETPELEALTRNVQGLFARIIGLAPYLPEELQLAAANVDDPSALCHLVASTLRTIRTDERQEILEQVDVEQRLRTVSAILSRELEVFELGSKIQSQVQSEMEKGQREYFLRQQLKAIQQELGEEDPEQAEGAELRERLDALGELPEEVRKSADRELQRLEKLPSAAAEYGVIRTYLEWILTLPWSTFTEDNLDLEHARQVLDADHFDLEKVKDRIIEYLAVAKLRNEVSGQILCFVGPPGVGKTLARPFDRERARAQVRAALGRRRARRVGDPRPPAHLHRLDARLDHPLAPRRRVGEPARPDRRDRQDGQRLARRPGERDARGARSGAEPQFRDHYLDLPFDLSKVLFICTANTLDTIPGPLLDRMDVIQLSGYTEEEKLGIAKRYLLPKQLRQHGLRQSQLTHLRQDAAHCHPRVHARGGRPQPRAPPRRHLPQGGDPGGEGPRTEDPRRRRAAARVARRTPVLRRGAQAHLRPGRRHRARVHRRRRRRPLHRGDRLSRQGQADGHRAARRGDAGVRADGALVGALARRARSGCRTTGSQSTTCTCTSRPARCRRTARPRA